LDLKKGQINENEFHMYTEGLTKSNYPADKCAILAPLIDLQRISYHYSAEYKKTFESSLSVQPSKMLKLVNKVPLYNNTILYKEDVFQPTEDSMFLDYGIYPNKTEKLYDDYYNVKLRIKPGELTTKKIKTCELFGCSGFNPASFSQGIDVVMEMQITKNINQDLLDFCKLLAVSDRELNPENFATNIALGRKLANHIEIKAVALYLDEINRFLSGSPNYVKLNFYFSWSC
jgi:hypothetical protein